MTKKEYADYQENVESFFKDEGITNLSAESGECCACGMHLESEPQAYFSHTACECCGSSLGGDRYHASGYNPETKEAYCYSVCTDCMYYAAYGQLDDQTMMDIEEGDD